MKQQNGTYDITVEKAKRDKILNDLEHARSRLVQAARYVAQELWDETQEPVTAGQVYSAMWDAMENDPDMSGILEQHDKRWLGAVFRGDDWERVGYIPAGSHGRLVAQWVPKTHTRKLAS